MSYFGFYDDAADQARDIERAGYLSSGYNGTCCNNPECGRARVMICDNGKLICEKCGWDQDKGDYSSYLSFF